MEAATDLPGRIYGIEVAKLCVVAEACVSELDGICTMQKGRRYEE